MKSYRFPTIKSTLRYLEFEGTGTPLIMIHGLGCSSSYDYPQVARSSALAKRHCLLIDMLGYGYSDKPEDFDYRVQSQAELLFEFLESRNFGQVDIYGHSMGGSVVIDLASMLGARVRSLILSEANLDNGGGAFSRRIASMSEENYVTSGHSRMAAVSRLHGNDDWATTMNASSPLAVYRGSVSLIEGSSPTWREKVLAHPAQKAFIFGELSLPDPDLEILQAQGISCPIVANAGHSMGTENPQGLAEAIAKSLVC